MTPAIGPSLGPPAVAQSAARAALAAALSAVRRSHPRLVLVDGPSGAGKSWLADALVAAWPGRPPRLVRLDELYPGWGGLDRAAEQAARTLVAPVLAGVPGRAHRWDWATSTPGLARSIPPDRALILEGCGAFRAGAASRHPRILRLWLDAPDGPRRRRALARDAGAFDAHWDEWERQWRHHRARSRPERAADLRLREGGVQRGFRTAGRAETTLVA